MLVEFLRIGFQISERKACRLVRIGRSSQRYKSCAKDQTALRIRLRDLAASRVRYGFQRLHLLLVREGWKVNHKRIHRLYKEEGLQLRLKKTGKKRASVPRVPPPPASAPNERWSMDFMADQLADGRKFRVLALVDHFSRVSPGIAAGFSMSGERVVALLEQMVTVHGLPKAICVDNGPEFISRALDAWAWRNGVQLCFSRPGKPTDNAFSEAFNSRLRQECLAINWFVSLEDAQGHLEAWLKDYNTERPHSSLGNQSPQEFLSRWRAPSTNLEACS